MYRISEKMILFSPVRISENSKRYFQITLTLLLVTLILFIRASNFILTPHFWFEDGSIYFAQNWQYGLHSILFPYAGYFVFAHRIIATIIGLFPLKIIPELYLYFSLLILLLVILKLFSNRIELPYKPLFALSIVLVPSWGEVYLNLNNSMTIIALLQLFILIQINPKSKLELISDTLLLTFTGLTGPFIFFTSPLYLLKLALEKTGYSLYIFLVSILLAAAQLYALFFHANSGGAQLLTISQVTSGINQWLNIIGVRIFKEMFIGFYYAHMQWYYQNFSTIFGIATLLISALIVFLLRKNKNYTFYAFCFLTYGLFTTLAAFSRMLPNELYSLGDRYFFNWHLMLMWSFILCFNLPNFFHNIAKLCFILFILASLSNFKTWTSQSVINTHWDHYLYQFQQKGKPIHIPIDLGWYIDIKPS